METQQQSTEQKPPVSTFGDRMQSARAGEFIAVENDFESPLFEEEEIELPGELMPEGNLRLSNTPDDMPKLIAGLRRWRGMTQAELGNAIGYPAPVIGNIEQGIRKLGLKTLGDLFAALGGNSTLNIGRSRTYANITMAPTDS